MKCKSVFLSTDAVLRVHCRGTKLANDEPTSSARTRDCSGGSTSDGFVREAGFKGRYRREAEVCPGLEFEDRQR